MVLESQIAMKLAPDRKKFMEVIGSTGDINADMEKFCATFSPLLEENHKFLVRILFNCLGYRFNTIQIYQQSAMSKTFVSVKMRI